jgi:hypothetical protein
MNRELINALFCAINVLRGTAGGFSPHEKANAITVLVLEMERLMAEGQAPQPQPPQS